MVQQIGAVILVLIIRNLFSEAPLCMLMKSVRNLQNQQFGIIRAENREWIDKGWDRKRISNG